jgi:hypothetical protein
VSDGRRWLGRGLGVAAIGLALVVPLLTRRLLGDDEYWIQVLIFAYHGHIVVTTSSDGDRGQGRWNPAVP